MGVTWQIHYGANNRATQDELDVLDQACWHRSDFPGDEGSQYILKHPRGRRQQEYPGYCEAQVVQGRYAGWPRWPARWAEHSQDVAAPARQNHDLLRCKLYRRLDARLLVGAPITGSIKNAARSREQLYIRQRRPKTWPGNLRISPCSPLPSLWAPPSAEQL